MPSISWDETVPQDVESAGLGAQRIQSLKTAIRIGLEAEHSWPSAGGDAGTHRLGSARAYYGPESAVSSTGTDGRLMVTSDTSRLFHVGSAGTMFLGGQRAISAGSMPVGGQTFTWVEEFGTMTKGAGTDTVTFPNSGYSGAPFVFLTPSSIGVGGTAFAPFLNAVTPTTFGVADGFGVTGYRLYWRSVGTRVL